MRGCSPHGACVGPSRPDGRLRTPFLWVRSVLCPMALWVLLKFGPSGGPIGSETRKDVIASSAPLGSSSASGLVRPRGLSDSCPASQRWGGGGGAGVGDRIPGPGCDPTHPSPAAWPMEAPSWLWFSPCFSNYVGWAKNSSSGALFGSCHHRPREPAALLAAVASPHIPHHWGLLGGARPPSRPGRLGQVSLADGEMHRFQAYILISIWQLCISAQPPPPGPDPEGFQHPGDSLVPFAAPPTPHMPQGQLCPDFYHHGLVLPVWERPRNGTTHHVVLLLHRVKEKRGACRILGKRKRSSWAGG
uniref:uncharacterized protein LOC132662114 n=1 Tax=Panthera onca TaxID=9690 RepID=UPI002955DF2F|nr:uncharacterized protein LOC132662114 [Panthera onca]